MPGWGTVYLGNIGQTPTIVPMHNAVCDRARVQAYLHSKALTDTPGITPVHTGTPLPPYTHGPRMARITAITPLFSLAYPILPAAADLRAYTPNANTAPSPCPSPPPYHRFSYPLPPYALSPGIALTPTHCHLSQELLVNIAPKKANWDLKRDVQPRLDKLERRTQRAILELLQAEERRRMEEEGGAQD